MATAFVAGEVALVRATFPALSNKDTALHVQRMSVDIDGDVQYRIDAGLALTRPPDSESSPSPTPTPTKPSKRPRH